MSAVLSILVAVLAMFELQYYLRQNKFKDISGYIITGILLTFLGLTVAAGLYTML